MTEDINTEPTDGRGDHATPTPAAPEQHPRNEFCFYCAPDDMLLRGISLHDEGKPWDGPTVHMQVPASFCPAMTDDPEVSS